MFARALTASNHKPRANTVRPYNITTPFTPALFRKEGAAHRRRVFFPPPLPFAETGGASPASEMNDGLAVCSFTLTGMDSTNLLQKTQKEVLFDRASFSAETEHSKPDSKLVTATLQVFPKNQGFPMVLAKSIDFVQVIIYQKSNKHEGTTLISSRNLCTYLLLDFPAHLLYDYFLYHIFFKCHS